METRQKKEKGTILEQGYRVIRIIDLHGHFIIHELWTPNLCLQKQEEVLPVNDKINFGFIEMVVL